MARAERRRAAVARWTIGYGAVVLAGFPVALAELWLVFAEAWLKDGIPVDVVGVLAAYYCLYAAPGFAVAVAVVERGGWRGAGRLAGLGAAVGLATALAVALRFGFQPTPQAALSVGLIAALGLLPGAAAGLAYWRVARGLPGPGAAAA